MTEGEIQRLREENRRLAARYDRLRRRKSVRAALAVAELVGRLRCRRGRLPEPDEPAEPESIYSRAPALDLLSVAPSVSVVIPIHDAFDQLNRCLESVLANTTTAAEIVLLDDASTDPRVADLLDGLEGRAGLRVLRNPENLGFVRTANRGFDAVEGDVILLNADTEVPPRWVEGLRMAAYSSAVAASVTALSDNAGAFSAPLPHAPNPMPAGLDADAVGRLVVRHSRRLYPATPTANGFCMYVKRAALADVGGFDAERFPRGYGEENDWSMRAGARGWRHLVDDATYVLHHRTASFGDERRVLAEAGMSEVRSAHPEYDGLVGEFLASRDMAAARERVATALASGDRVRPRVLYILHDFAGGVAETTADLASGISGRYDPLVLRSGAGSLRLESGAGEVVEQRRLDPPLRLEDTTRHDYRAVVGDLLVRHGVEVVHVRHLLKHTLDLPAVAQGLGLPVALSVHDYYLLCPTAHLIDESGRFCRGRCTPGQGVCPSSPWVADGPHLKHGWVEVWKRRVETMLEHVDVVVSASGSAAEVHRKALPAFDRARWAIIEHGRDLPRLELGSFPGPGEPIRLLMVGTVGAYKGARLVSEIARLDADGRIEFHVLGSMPEAAGGAVVHGRYRREELAERVAEIEPAAVALLSVWAETYSHVLTEAWSMGLPVLATDLGAPAERIRAQGGGWLVDPEDPAAVHRRILEIFSDPAEYERRRAEALDASWPSVSGMAAAYADLYDRLRAERLTAPVL